MSRLNEELTVEQMAALIKRGEDAGIWTTKVEPVSDTPEMYSPCSGCNADCDFFSTECFGVVSQVSEEYDEVSETSYFTHACKKHRNDV